MNRMSSNTSDSETIQSSNANDDESSSSASEEPSSSYEDDTSNNEDLSENRTASSTADITNLSEEDTTEDASEDEGGSAMLLSPTTVECSHHEATETLEYSSSHSILQEEPRENIHGGLPTSHDEGCSANSLKQQEDGSTDHYDMTFSQDADPVPVQNHESPSQSSIEPPRISPLTTRQISRRRNGREVPQFHETFTTAFSDVTNIMDGHESRDDLESGTPHLEPKSQEASPVPSRRRKTSRCNRAFKRSPLGCLNIACLLTAIACLILSAMLWWNRPMVGPIHSEDMGKFLTAASHVSTATNVTLHQYFRLVEVMANDTTKRLEGDDFVTVRDFALRHTVLRDALPLIALCNIVASSQRDTWQWYARDNSEWIVAAQLYQRRRYLQSVSAVLTDDTLIDSVALTDDTILGVSIPDSPPTSVADSVTISFEDDPVDNVSPPTASPTLKPVSVTTLAPSLATVPDHSPNDDLPLFIAPDVPDQTGSYTSPRVPFSIHRAPVGDPLPGDFSATEFIPVWQVQPLPDDLSIINYDILQNAIARRMIDYMRIHETQAFSPPLASWSDIVGPTMEETGKYPKSMIVQPIFDTLEDTRSIGALYLSFIDWEKVWWSVLHAGIEVSVTVVLDSNCGDSHTFLLHGTTSAYVGPGDLHDESLAGWSVSEILVSEREPPEGIYYTPCATLLKIYPVEILESSASPSGEASSRGLYLYLVFAALGLMTLSGALYVIETRQSKSGGQSVYTNSSKFMDTFVEEGIRNQEAELEKLNSGS